MSKLIDPIAHYQVLQQLRDDGCLDPRGPHASISNRRWFRSDGTPRQERQAEHQRIIGEVLGSSSETHQQPIPVAILLAGPPGSGNSSARRALFQFQAGDEQITGGLKDFLTPHEAKALQT